MCFIEVIDTAGQEEYATLRDQWVRWGQGFILVYSIASRSTFDRLDDFLQSLVRVKGEKPKFVLVGNKADKTSEREVLQDEGKRYATLLGCDFIETSARTAHNVDRLFEGLIRTLRNTRDGADATSPISGEKSMAGNFEQVKQPMKIKKKNPKCVIL